MTSAVIFLFMKLISSEFLITEGIPSSMNTKSVRYTPRNAANLSDGSVEVEECLLSQTIGAIAWTFKVNQQISKRAQTYECTEDWRHVKLHG